MLHDGYFGDQCKPTPLSHGGARWWNGTPLFEFRPAPTVALNPSATNRQIRVLNIFFKSGQIWVNRDVLESPHSPLRAYILTFQKFRSEGPFSEIYRVVAAWSPRDAKSRGFRVTLGLPRFERWCLRARDPNRGRGRD